MYQQNPYQQQSFGGQQQTQQTTQNQTQQVYLQEQDLANFVLSELKRTAREYTTAALEAANPQIRQTFQTLLQKTLQDQAIVFQEIQKVQGYGELQTAQQQQVQQELQKQSQSAAQLQSFVQQNLSKMNTGGYQQQNQGISQQQGFQPLQGIGASAFQSGPYTQNQSFNQAAQSQSTSFAGSQQSQLQDQNYSQSQGYGTDYGIGATTGRGYYAGSSSVSESPSLGVKGQSLSSRNAIGHTSGHSMSEGSANSSTNKSDGSKYSF